jgi:hypothetical protein
MNSMALAEIMFYDKDGSIVYGKPIYDKNGSTSLLALFDEDILTSEYLRNWVGVDFGKSVALSKIRVMPKND